VADKERELDREREEDTLQKRLTPKIKSIHLKYIVLITRLL